MGSPLVWQVQTCSISGKVWGCALCSRYAAQEADRLLHWKMPCKELKGDEECQEQVTTALSGDGPRQGEVVRALLRVISATL